MIMGKSKSKGKKLVDGVYRSHFANELPFEIYAQQTEVGNQNLFRVRFILLQTEVT